ncbi:golgin subfamily A member 4-like isoform X5 [Centruroides vittatus]|uniref:golgin subfamily A member 4-like isoform X5 n=1 Tax=Centruroides vittatus TaxID=120091 RepID=UPI00350FFBF1
MFKSLRKKLAEEAEALGLPSQVGETSVVSETPEKSGNQTREQYASFMNSGNKTNNEIASSNNVAAAEDLIDLNSSTGNSILRAEKQQFSIIDEDDSNASEPNSPRKTQEDSSAGSEANYSSKPTILNIEQPEPKNPFEREMKNSKQGYVPQSDIESEVEDHQALNLDGISKEQLIYALQKLRTRIHKYKSHYSEAVKAYRELHSEKEKLERTVTDSQDKALRRITELREQCQLEQQAKAHLELNLRMLLEEKDQKIHVLETKINLLKEGNSGEAIDNKVQGDSPTHLLDLDDKKSNDQEISEDNGGDISVLKEKIKRQELLLSKCKDTLKSNKERTTQLIEEKNSLLEQLEKSKTELQDFQVNEAEIQASLRADLQQMKVRLEELEKQQEENAMSMAETKRNMHEELELREQQLSKLKLELQNVQQDKQFLNNKVKEQNEKITKLENEHQEKVNKLQSQLELTEKNMEEERQNLMQELSRGKAAALSLLKEECKNKISVAEEEWKIKIDDLQKEHQKELSEKDKEMEMALQKQAEEFKKCLEGKNEQMSLAIEEQTLQKSAALTELDIQKNQLIRNAEELTTRQLQSENESTLMLQEEKFVLEMDNRIKELQQEKDAVISDLKEKLKELNASLANKEEEIEEIQCKYTSFENQFKEVMHSLEDKIKELENDKQSLVNEMEKCRETKDDEIKELTARYEETISKHSEEKEELTARIAQEYQTKIGQLEEEIRVLNNQLDESLLVAEANQSAVSQKLADYKSQLSEKEEEESELKHKLEELISENNRLTEEKQLLDELQNEKLSLNNKLKEAEEQYNEVLREKDCSLDNLTKEIAELNLKLSETSKEKEDLKSMLQEEIEKLRMEKCKLKEEANKWKLRQELLNQQVQQKEPEDLSVSLLKEENNMLKEQLGVLETQTFGVNHVENYQTQLTAVIKNYEEKLKEKDSELNSKLKQIIREFNSQLELKDNECEETLSNLIGKGQEQESKMEKEHRREVASLQQELFEKTCALEDVTEHFQQLLRDKEEELNECKQKLKESKILQARVEKNEIQASQEPQNVEANDWEDGWEDAEDTTPVAQQTEAENQSNLTCTAHEEEIASLKTEKTNLQEEIGELRFLLGLTSKPSTGTSNHTEDISLKVPEPTEFEYLRNIMYEYMMGKEPFILAKVITAVLKFDDDQTRQILQREASRQVQRTHWLSSA